MRIVFIDMHCVNFLTNVYSQIKSGMKVKTYKHRFIVDYALSNGIEVCSYITGKDTTSPLNRRIFRYINNININKRLSLREHEVVIRKSYGNNAQIKAILDPSEIRDSDIVVGFFHKEIQRQIVPTLPGHRIMFGNHFIDINKPTDLAELGLEAFVNEIDLSDNLFANKYLNIRNVRQLVCPYVFAGRFVNQHKERKNKLMGIGTLSTVKGNHGYGMYREYFGTEWIQPMRKEIMDKAPDYPTEIDSYISYILEDKKEIKESDSTFVRWYKKIYNRYKPWTQSKYTSFDMVDKFNEYTMFVCPEELVGMPGIGFVEGMACGTAYIGLDTDYYKKLGLIAGKNYITYDGTFEDLIRVVRYYQDHREELKIIAAAGEELVRDKFNTDRVARDLMDAFREIAMNG